MKCALVLEGKSRAALHKRIRERESDSTELPVCWHEVIDEFCREYTGRSALAGRLMDVIGKKGFGLSWSASLEAIIWVLTGGRAVYLCWGVPKQEGISRWRTVTLLRRATVVLTHEDTTTAEVRACSRSPVEIVPFFVDLGYFTWSDDVPRKKFLFCPGSNDRDPEMLAALADSGLQVTWLVNDADKRARYSRLSPNLCIVSHISFAILKNLYRTCSLVVMPSAVDRHCAGQTTTLEAIACGTPVLISRGRTAAIFEDHPSVFVVGEDSISAWIAAISHIQNDKDIGKKCRASRALLEARNDREVVKGRLKEVFARYIEAK